MKNYPYFANLMLRIPPVGDGNGNRRDEFTANIARKIATIALKGGDPEVLLEMIKRCPRPRTTRDAVFQYLRGTERGSRMLGLLILFAMYENYPSVNLVRDYLNRVENYCDDAEEMGEYLDSRSFIRCSECGEWEREDSTRSHYTNSEAMVCRICINESFTYSEYYEEYVRSEDGRWAYDADGSEVFVHEDDDSFVWNEGMQRYVHEDYEPPEPEIMGSYHSSKSMQRPIDSNWTRLKKRYLGVELEVEVLSDKSSKVKHLHKLINEEEFGKNVFFERDGSLNDGVEIISQPMGMDRHEELWSWLKDRNAVSGLRSHNTSTCGLHVHVSRDRLSKLQVAKIVTFINSRENEDLIKAVARRYSEGYCKIKNKKIGNAYQSEDRYEAVNITPRKTIEFRIFKGSLKYESVMAALQFANAVVEYCAEGVASINDLKTEPFLKFVQGMNKEDNKYLLPYIGARLERETI